MKYKWTVATYRLANLIFSLKTATHNSSKPLWRAHGRLAQQLHPFIQQLLGNSISGANTQLLAQAGAVLLPIAALMLLLLAFKSRRRHQER